MGRTKMNGDDDSDDGEDEESEEVVTEEVIVPQSAKKTLDVCDCPIETDRNFQCCASSSGDDWTDYATECDAHCNGATKCESGTCASNKKSAAMVGHHSYLSGGLVQSTTHSSQWNIMIVIIQLCILAVCCMSLGLSISFCFKNPNQLMGAGKKRFANDMV